jgi:hypothetical protein
MRNSLGEKWGENFVAGAPSKISSVSEEPTKTNSDPNSMVPNVTGVGWRKQI